MTWDKQVIDKIPGESPLHANITIDTVKPADQIPLLVQAFTIGLQRTLDAGGLLSPTPQTARYALNVSLYPTPEWPAVVFNATMDSKILYTLVDKTTTTTVKQLVVEAEGKCRYVENIEPAPRLQIAYERALKNNIGSLVTALSTSGTGRPSAPRPTVDPLPSSPVPRQPSTPVKPTASNPPVTPEEACRRFPNLC
jgi:hypothetical protein